MYSKKIIKKIPGDLPSPSKKESQGYIDDLGKKQIAELKELLERQNKILSNTKYISKLPDKGEKIVAFKNKLLKELDHRNEVEKAAEILSRLNIASEGKTAMTELEWTGKYTEKQSTKVVELDSDDEEDPLKILAQPTGTGAHKKKIIRVTHEESLIKPEDIEEIESFKTDVLDVEHVKYIVKKTEGEKDQRKQPFKPYKTTKGNIHDPMKEKERKEKIKNKNWEVTAATPPFIVHSAAKVISLNESLVLQKIQTDKLKEVQAKHAAERLAEQLGLHNEGSLPQNAGKYRLRDDEHNSDSSSSSDGEEEHEVHDEEDNDKAGTVVYTVDSVEC